MRHWKPQPSIGRWFGLGLLVVTLSGVALMIFNVSRFFAGPPQTWPITLELYVQLLGLFALVMFSATLLYRLASVFTLNYELDRNGLYITWLGNRAVVPLDQIHSVDVGVSFRRSPLRLIPGIGYHWGKGRSADDRLIHLFTTKHPSQSLVIYTPGEAYVISPADHETFVQDLEQRRNLGTTKPLASMVEPGRMFLYAFWNDPIVRVLLLICLGLHLLVLAFLAARYPSLSHMIEMHFTAAGEAVELRPRHQILFLPLAAMGLSLVNILLGLLLYGRQRVGAWLLQGTSVVVQLLFGVAVATIIQSASQL